MYWMLYDISDNKARAKLIRLCMDCGLVRIQKSCFFGKMEEEQLQRLERGVANLIGKEDCACLIPVTKATLEQTKIWGVSVYEEEVNGNDVCFV